MLKRLLCWAAASYITGVFSAQYISIEQSIVLVFIALLICIVKIIISRNTVNLFPAMLFVCMLAVGTIQFKIASNTNLKPIAQFVDKPVTFTCQVIEQPVVKKERIEYTVRISRVYFNNNWYSIHTKVKLICPGNNKTPIYQYGDILQVRNELHIPPQPFNEGGFNYNYYLNAKGIHAVSYAAPYQIKKIGVLMRTNIIEEFVYRSRQSITRTVNKFLPENEAALLKGIIIGDRTGFSEKMTENFSRSGLSHLVAVSGMHVAILLTGITYLLGLFNINKYLSKVISIIFIILFIFITGCTPSVLRASIMAIIFLLSYLVNREADAYTSLFFSALAILLYNPIILFDIGFQLSFCATLSLFLFYKPIYSKLGVLPKWIREVAAASIAAQIGTVIIVAYHFNGVSLISIVSNLIVVPFTSIVLISGVILYVLGSINAVAGYIIAGFSYVLLKFILFSSSLFANLPFATLAVPSPDLFFVIAYLLILFMLYNLLQGTKNIFQFRSVFFLLIVVFISSVVVQFWQKNNLEVTFVNVGQGDCIFLRCPGGKTILVDGGGSEGRNDYNVGENIVIPYLLKRGVMSIDVAVVSHYHDDHAEGILTMLENMLIKTLMLPLREEENQLKKNLVENANHRLVPIYYLSKGDKLKIDNKVVVEVLGPGMNQVKNPLLNENNKSLILKLQYGSVSFLLTGDIEKEAEGYIAECGGLLTANVLKVPHHGSDTSSTEKFLRQVSPEYAVISVGRNNFGHPSRQVLERLENNKISIYRTDVNGTVTFITDGKVIKNIKVFKEGE